MINYRGIKARVHDLDAMLAHNPSMVELHCSVGDLDWMPQKNYDLPLAVHVPEYTKDGTLLDPASPDEEVRKLAENVYGCAAGRAAAWSDFFVGTPLVVFHPGGQSPSSRMKGSMESRYDALGKTIKAMKAEAGGGASILLENLPRTCCFFSGVWKANIVTGGRELADLCERYDVDCTLDLCHLYLACMEDGKDFLYETTQAMPYAKHIHYSDARGTDGEGLQIGEGDLPLREALDIFRSSDVMAIPEIWFGHEKGGRAFPIAWERTEALMKEATRT